MAKILIVDDEEKIRFVVREYGEFSGHEVAEASDGSEADARSREENFDLVILDIMMPKVDGFTACKELRKFSQVPVIMLSARGEEYDKLFGFELGIDDYVVKPFSPKVLMARISAVLARAGGGGKKKDGLVFEGLKIDIPGRNVSVDGAPAQLTPKEYDLLFFLVENRGIAMSREKLITEVWGYDYYGDDRTLDTHIKMLRANLGPYRKFIVTLRSMGYKFEA